MRKVVSAASVVAALSISLACGQGGGAPVERPQVMEATQTVSEPTPAPVPDPVDAAGEEPIMMTRLPPERYSNNWLVITQSTEQVEPVSPELVALSEVDPLLVAPDQLHSGEFKGLMPCWVTTIAGGAEDRGDAVAILERVKAAGIDAYLKNAGEYVGPAAATIEMCEQLRTDLAECPDGARVAHVVDGAWQVALTLPEGVLQAALSGASQAKRATERGDAWTAPLVVQTLGSVAVGDGFTVQPIANEASLSCSVTGFAATTLGMPHFGMASADEPTCGSPQAFAVLDCAEDVVQSGLAVAPGEPIAAWTLAPAIEGESDSDLIATVRSLPMIRSVYERALADAGERSLQQSVRVTPATRGAARTAIVELTFFTGEGRADCGMDDVVHRVGIAVTEEGIPVSAATDLSFAEVAGLVTLPSGGQAALVTAPWFGGMRLSDTCGLDVAYCDCAC